MNILYLEASLEPKPNFSFYMTPKNRQVEMTKFRLDNLAPELIPFGCSLSLDFKGACSCAYYFGLESYYETFGLSSVQVAAFFGLDNVLPEWRNISLPDDYINFTLKSSHTP